MTTITLDLAPETYQRLLTKAQQYGTPVEAVAEQLLTAQLINVTLNDQDRALAMLRAAGLLVEPSDTMRQLAIESTLTLEEAQAILNRTEGKPLSEVILEMRGPKV